LIDKKKKATEAEQEDSIAAVDKLDDNANMSLEDYPNRVPNLSRIVRNMFTLCSSGAEIERFFKKLRMILKIDSSEGSSEGSDSRGHVEVGDVHVL
tara:strand:+ start:223 stop:510 length:288 start_codon:yes stop_codon:yes gene_type:complete